MPELNAKQKLRVDGISEQSSRMMRVRAREAAEIRPSLSIAIEGLIWKRMSMLKKILSETTTFGAEVYLIADVLVSEDEKKKKMLLGEKGDMSLFWRIASEEGSGDSGTDQGPRIRDLQGYYAHLDPELGRFAELVDYWTWWDLPDAIDLFVFETAGKRYEARVDSPLTDQVKQAYRPVLNKQANQEVTRKEILASEIANAERVIGRFEERLTKEPSFRKLLGYKTVENTERQDPEDSSSEKADGLILEIARHLTGVQEIKESPELDAPMKSYYARALEMAPDQIKPADVLGFEREKVSELKSDLMALISNEGIGVQQAYDYKHSALEALKARTDEMKKYTETVQD